MKKLRKRLTWQTLRTACIPIRMKGSCSICPKNVPAQILLNHTSQKIIDLGQKILLLISETELILLEDQQMLKNYGFITK